MGSELPAQTKETNNKTNIKFVAYLANKMT